MKNLFLQNSAADYSNANKALYLNVHMQDYESVGLLCVSTSFFKRVRNKSAYLTDVQVHLFILLHNRIYKNNHKFILFVFSLKPVLHNFVNS